MIEETGVVVAVEGDHVWLETQVKTTCGSCKANESCPTSVVAKAFSPKPEHIYLQVPCKLVVGQQVKIGISPQALLHASLMVYMVPLLAFIFLAVLVQYLFPELHELLMLALSSLGALAGFWWASAQAKSNKYKSRFAPVFLGATQQAVMSAKQEIPTHKIQ